MISFILTMKTDLLYFTGIKHMNSWQRLRAESCALRERGLSHGSWANRVSHLRTYLTFTTYFGVEDFPLDPGVLLRFIAFLGRGSHTYESVINLLGSIKYFASILDPPACKHFETVQVTASLKGLKAQLSRPVRQKLPFSVNHLLTFHACLNLNDAKHLACWCAMLLGFFGCFRLSNLVPVSMCKYDPHKQLNRCDIRFEDNLVLIYYKWSKTNQNSRKVSWIPICNVSDSRFNLRIYFDKLLTLVKAPKDAPLFSYSKSHFHSRYSLVRLLDQCLFVAGLSPSDYSWHSFRRGAAVFAFELGLADSAVQLLGDWSSAAFKRYLEFAFLKKVTVAELIAKSFDECVKDC